MMRRAILIVSTFALAACAQDMRVVQPVQDSGNRADGIVTMSSTTSIYQPVLPDLLKTAQEAGQQCAAWGFEGGTTFAGSKEFCPVYDGWGRCSQTIVTRYYACGS